jgi:transcriptional regulator with XRE-family HTH domain
MLIRDIRNKLGLTQSELASLLGCSNSTIQRLERAGSSGIDAGERLSAILNILENTKLTGAKLRKASTYGWTYALYLVLDEAFAILRKNQK